MTGKQSEIVQKPLQGMFSDIPPRYDLINTLITWNMDKRWRKLAAKACLDSQPKRVLDLCCGTGDLAIEMAKITDENVEINGLDFSQPMLEIARKKAGKEVSNKNIKFFQGEADQLPFQEAYFDSLGISFGFRNLTYKNPLAARHLFEIVRVIKTGGRCVIAESSQPKSKIIRSLYHFYMRAYSANIGACLSGNKGAYQYLAESACRYYSPPEMERLLIESGFKSVRYHPLLYGAAGIYVAIK